MSPRPGTQSSEWCQCEDAAHDEASPVMCTCPRGVDGARLATLRSCPVHNGDRHAYGVLDRSSAPRMTVFGVFCVCRPCRAAGHMGVRP